MDTSFTASCFNLLGGLLYLKPSDTDLAPVFAILDDPNWTQNWPCGTPEELSKIAALLAQEAVPSQSLSEAHTALFIGPDHLQAPPWGSVYLDPERVVFGHSTLKLREFLAEEGIALNMDNAEPEDHIGLLLLTAAWLGVEKRDRSLSLLLAEHILPWAPTYFNLLRTASPHPFYRGIAELGLLTLDAMSKTLDIEARPLQIYQ